MMLKIENLHAGIDGKEILKGINLQVNAGEVHAIMGPNGSGKSTMSNVLVGHPSYQVTEGSVTFKGKNLLDMPAEDRSHEGLFMSFQYPVEIPGVSMTNFMRTAINEKRKYLGLQPMSPTDFLKLIKEKRDLVKLDAKFMNRSVNEGFSGGEKKRNEIFQMAMLEPSLSILDETDSGLDIDALRQTVEARSSVPEFETVDMVVSGGAYYTGDGNRIPVADDYTWSIDKLIVEDNTGGNEWWNPGKDSISADPGQSGQSGQAGQARPARGHNASHQQVGQENHPGAPAVCEPGRHGRCDLCRYLRRAV